MTDSDPLTRGQVLAALRTIDFDMTELDDVIRVIAALPADAELLAARELAEATVALSDVTLSSDVETVQRDCARHREALARFRAARLADAKARGGEG